ncbi:MAG: recombination-associated protein RdgC [Gammaproteobacteria bacterium]|nr:recombination-associated protein RdgC [Gammaproteobacteria bacterium]
MFRNVRFYRIKTVWPKTEEELSEQLSNNRFKPCGPYTELSAGWEAPATELPDTLCRRLNGADLLRLRSQTRVLPAAAINEALEERMADYEVRMQEKPSTKQKRRLKAELREELLPKALLKSERINGFYIHSLGLLGIEAGSENKAERFLDSLRAALGSLDAIPLLFNKPVADWLNSVFLGKAPDLFRLGRECKMQEPTLGGAVVNWKDIDLADMSIQKHVIDGMKIERLALEFDDIMNCVLDQNGAISKLKFVGSAESEVETSDESLLAKQDAQFVLLTGTLTRFVESLKKTLGGYS